MIIRYSSEWRFSDGKIDRYLSELNHSEILFIVNPSLFFRDVLTHDTSVSSIRDQMVHFFVFVAWEMNRA